MERFPVVSVFIVVSCFQRFLMTSSSILEEMIYLCTYLYNKEYVEDTSSYADELANIVQQYL